MLTGTLNIRTFLLNMQHSIITYWPCVFVQIVVRKAEPHWLINEEDVRVRIPRQRIDHHVR